MMISDKEGKNWQRVSLPLNTPLTSVFFLDTQLGWAVGYDALILKTEDGGMQWTAQHHLPIPKTDNPLFDICFKDSVHGLAVGANGQFLTTADGGVSWSKGQVPSMDRHLYAITVAQNSYWVAGEGGSIYRSPDGIQWEKITSPYAGSFFGLLKLPSDELLLFGLRGKIFRGNEKGWTEIHTSSDASLLSGTLTQDGNILLVGIEGGAWISSDGSKSFESLPIPFQDHVAAAVMSDHALILATESGLKRIENENI